MIRTPLRPLAQILRARKEGRNPDTIERENIRQRHEELRGRDRRRAEGRILVMGVMFFFAFALIGGRMAVLAQSEPPAPRTSADSACSRGASPLLVPGSSNWRSSLRIAGPGLVNGVSRLKYQSGAEPICWPTIPA